MNINYNHKQSFKGLNFQEVSTVDRIFVKANFKQLKELGQKYDIKLTSTYGDSPEYSAIDIDVKPLSKNLNIWEKFFGPTGSKTFQAKRSYLYEPMRKTIIESINDAIADLKYKINQKGGHYANKQS